MSEQSVTIVIPAFNNADSLPELSDRLKLSLRDFDLQIIVIDDCSSDSTLTLARSLDVEMIRNEVNVGQNASILRGLKSARGEYIVVMDADLQDQPEHLPDLLSPVMDGACDVAFSTRSGQARLSSRLFRSAMKLLNPGLPFGACLHFACSRQLASDLSEVATESDYLVAVLGILNPDARVVRTYRGRRKYGKTGYPGIKRFMHAGRLLAASVRRRMVGRRAAGGGRDQPIRTD